MKPAFTLLFLTIFLIIVSACAGTNPTDEPSATAIPPGASLASDNPWAGTYFTINEVGLGENGYVSLTNFTDVPTSLDRLYLCQGSECFALPDVTVDAGQTVRIAIGDGGGLDGVVATQAALGELHPADGEIALFDSQNFEDPKSMKVYFQWGSTPHELTQLAIDAGLWIEGGYGPSSENATRVYKVEESGLWLFEEP